MKGRGVFSKRDIPLCVSGGCERRILKVKYGSRGLKYKERFIWKRIERLIC